MQMLQQVLFRQHCNQNSLSHHKELRKYRHKVNKQSNTQTMRLPVYILQKFKKQPISSAKQPANKTIFPQNSSNNEIFVQRKKMKNHRQSLSPLRTQKNLKEYSNLLFVKRTEELKLPSSEHIPLLPEKQHQQKYSTLTVYHNRSQNKLLKQIQPNSCQLQGSRLPILGKLSNRRKHYIDALQMQHLTTTNLGTCFRNKLRKSQMAEEKGEQVIQICGWQDGDIFQ